VTVDFRALFPEVGATERATHNLHPYPAKLLRHIPAFFVAAEQVSPPDAVVLDPFCGSGTTLLEALLASRPAIGVDVNPLATLLAKVKTTAVGLSRARRALDATLKRARKLRAPNVRNRPRLEYWFEDQTLLDLARLRMSIESVHDPDTKDLLDLSLSIAVRDVSLADPRISVPVRLRPERYPPDHWLRAPMTKRLSDVRGIDTMAVFERVARYAIERVARLEALPPRSISVRRADARLLADDARSTQLCPESIDLILTSPPYLGAQKYIRACSLNLLTLDLADGETLGHLTDQSVGREHFRKSEYTRRLPTAISEADDLIDECHGRDPLRACLAATYLRDMREALRSMTRLVRPGGAVVIVAGNNTLSGVEFPTPRFLEALAHEQGLVTELRVLDVIRSRGLMTRRNRSASVIDHESVMVFRK
jgi:DNA modification methylase